MSTRSCSIPGCEGKFRARGYCNAHYKQYRQGRMPGRPFVPLQPKGCAVPGCEGKHRSRGYCEKHYQQQWRKGYMPPPRPAGGRVSEEIEALGGVEYLGVKGIMDALSMTASSIVAALRREGRQDLAPPFAREEDQERAARKPTAITGVYLTPRDLADRLGIPRQTVYTRDSRGTGPKVTKDGYFTYYRLEDVVEWEQRNKAGRAA